MDSIGETRWLILTPGSVSTVHGRGSCRSATRRTFFAALWTDFKKSGLTCDLADRISSREIQTPARVRSRSSSFLLQAKRAESPRLRTSDDFSGHGLRFVVALGAA